jgi:dTDP-4-dehydrorhamnose 3,5-epimerase
VTDYYAPKAERTILWSDPDLAIPWPVAEGDVIVSDKDRNGAPLQLAEVFS